MPKRPNQRAQMNEYGMPQFSGIPEASPSFDLDVPREALSPENQALTQTPDFRMIEEFDMEPIEKFDWEQEPFDDSSIEAAQALMQQNPKLLEMMMQQIEERKNSMMQKYGF